MLITERCYNYGWTPYCDADTLYKTDITAVKKSLGTVYSTDPALNGSWIAVQGTDYLYFDPWFEGAGGDGFSRYLSSSKYYDWDCDYDCGEAVWYTSGSKLFLAEVDEDDDYMSVVTRIVELNYSITGSGDSRELTIHYDGNEDVFVPYRDDDDDDWYSPAKLRQNKRIGNREKDAGKSAISQLFKIK